MSELQLIVVTQQDYYKYKQLEQNIFTLNLEITNLKQQLADTKNIQKMTKQLTQENNEIKSKVMILSRESIRLARAVLDKEENITELNQQLIKISKQADESTIVRLEQENKLMKQQAKMKENMEIELQKTKKDLLRLQQKYHNDLLEVQKKWREAEDEVERLTNINKSMMEEMNGLKNVLEVKNKDYDQLQIKYDLMACEMQKMKKLSEQMDQKWTEKLQQTEKYIMQQQTQIQLKVSDLQLENQRLNKQIQILNLKLINTKELHAKQIHITKKLQKDYRKLCDQLQTQAGQLIVYKNQVSKLEAEKHERQALVDKITQKNRTVQQENKNLMDELSAWKLMISQEQGIKWSNLLNSSWFQAELKSKKKVYHYCKQLLFKHLQFVKLQILNSLNTQEDHFIYKTFKQQIKSVLGQFPKHINMQSFKDLM